MRDEPQHEHAEEARRADAGPTAPSPPVAAAGVLSQLTAAPPGRGSGAQAAVLARRIGAAAGNRALARQVAGQRLLQRRLIATGEVDRFFRLVEPAIGLELSHDAATNEVTAVASSVTPATSPALAALLTRIMDDPSQDAEVHFGHAQDRVAIGAFPQPSDLTGSREQRIDLDDIENIQAGAPGHGLAHLAHEINENYTAHSQIPSAGVDLFPVSHGEGIQAENAVARDLVNAGATRVAARVAPGASANQTIQVRDFTTHYLVWTQTRTGLDFAVSASRVAARNPVATYTIDGFATGSEALPAGGAAIVASARADLIAHPQSTAHIEGFTDDIGSAGVNLAVGRRRANAVRAAILAGGAGVPGGALFAVGRGETSFVAANTSAANRARNRRVVITISEPAP